MSCPFCGTSLSKVAAICPSCKIQLPEANLFPYYAAALDRDKSLAQPDKRSKLDGIVEKEALARSAMIAEARERAKEEEAHQLIERAKSEKALRLRQEAAAEESRLRRERFMQDNGKKLKIWGAIGVITIGALVGATNYLKPEPPKPVAPKEDIKVEPCLALGTAAKKTLALLNLTLEKNVSDGGLSGSEINSLNLSARDIQAELMGTTSGQTLGQPGLEEAIQRLANNLGIYGDSISDIKTESALVNRALEPIRKLAASGQRACASAGFADQFNETSGWDK
ncbi:hypothetical protein MCEMRE26_00497 [Candidatus Nanopelagicaceae bacterium]